MRSRLTLACLFLSLASWSCGAADTKDKDKDSEPGFNEATFKGLEMRGIGPALMSGRIADIALDPDSRSTWYVAVGSGGVWKTTNAGTTWNAVFENEGSYSVGCVTLDPNRKGTVWVGSGENVSGRHVGYGDGVYRSRDGGATWENLGLRNSQHIGMIRIDPRDSDVVYVAAQGPLWSGGGDRGLFKTTDGGQNWEKILGDGQYTGVTEVHLDPRNPDVLYAATWQRLRTVAALMDGGPGTAIHKSEDGGQTWRKLAKGLPEEFMGKIGMAVSPINPDVVYAGIELANRKGGFYRSADGGESWEKRSDFVASGTGPHYYQEVFASPHDFDHLYHMDVMMHVSTDGGTTFERTERDAKHSDHHALAFDPRDPDYLIAGTDGGLYESFDKGDNWRYVANLPVTQFYKVAVDYDEPFYNVYGGTQDNNTQGGPSRTDNVTGIRNSDWFVTLQGDGHQPASDYSNPDIVYAQWQQGNLTRYDRVTGESVYIRPQPAAGEPSERFNWDAPIVVSPHDPATLFFASQRVWRSDNRGDSWRAISGDLSRNIERLKEPMMGRRWSFNSPWDQYAMSRFGTITSLSQSPQDPDLIYVGTDDGLIQVSENGGESWRRVDSLPGVPDQFFVNDIKADLFDVDTVYIAVDQHKIGDFRPFLLKSTNRGRSWRSIARGLPERHLVWRVVQDHKQASLLFAGTEFGVFFSVSGGDNWTKLAGGAPNIPFRDLAIQKREDDLVGATFGRGFYVLDDYSPLRLVSDKMLREQTLLFPVRTTPWYVPKRPLGCTMDGCVSSQGGAFFVAPNPPFGAVFTYYLPEAIQSLKDQRREQEKPLEKDGKDTPFPGWDRLGEEAAEDAPAMVLTVRDSEGNVVRHVEGPVDAGFHRVAWDLRYPHTEPWEEDTGEVPYGGTPVGVMALPGQYSVSLARRVDGKLTDLAQPQSFEVTSIRSPTLAGPKQTERMAFAREVADLTGRAKGDVASIDEAAKQLGAMKQALMRATTDPALYAEAQRISKALIGLRERLTGNKDRDFANESGPVEILSRLFVAGFGSRVTVYGPTQTQRDSLQIASTEYAAVSGQLDTLLEQALPALATQLDAAGVPWTPGR